MPNSRQSLNATNKQADIRYFQTFMGLQWRPNAKMPIDRHQYCEQVLRQVAKATQGRQGAHQPVLFVRGTLDDWAMREWGVSVIGHKLADSLYCFDENDSILNNQQMELLLDNVVKIITSYYPAGRALTKISVLIFDATCSIRSWNCKRRGKVGRNSRI